MGDISTGDNRLASMRVLAEVRLLPAVTNMVRQVGLFCDLPEKTIAGLELASEEACLNVIEHAFEPGEKGHYDVEIVREPGSLVIAIEDQGVPFDFDALESQPEEGKGLGALLMRAYTDEIRFRYLGKRGKRLELVKALGRTDLDSYLSPDEQKTLAAAQPAAAMDIPITYRLMAPSEAVELLRCIYRVYGYSYVHEEIYFPDKIAELIQSGVVESCVAVTPENKIVGHLAMIHEAPGDLVAESAQAVVDPSFRGRSIFEKMKEFMLAHAARQGMKGLYSRAVTVHPASQKTNLKMGSKETGIVIGHSPATAIFKQIHESADRCRRSVVLFYAKAAPDAPRILYLPRRHQAILERIYGHNGLNRLFASLPEKQPALGDQARIDVKVTPDTGSAFLLVEAFGRDFLAQLRFRLRELCERAIELIVLDMPLTDPYSAALCPKIEALGFFFCGIIPEKRQGDVIRFEYLNNVTIDLSKIVIASDFGRELLAYIADSAGLSRA
jgi:anti-sigma regulatory factor (Ser/Thr protein kinase)/GNAT superfamily N-acetyltransferase